MTNHELLVSSLCPHRRLNRKSGPRVVRSARRLERGELVAWHEHLNCARLAQYSPDKPASLEGHNHVVHRRRRYPEEPLHVGLCRRPSIQRGIHGDEGEVLTLVRREPWLFRTWDQELGPVGVGGWASG